LPTDKQVIVRDSHLDEVAKLCRVSPSQAPMLKTTPFMLHASHTVEEAVPRLEASEAFRPRNNRQKTTIRCIWITPQFEGFEIRQMGTRDRGMA